MDNEQPKEILGLKIFISFLYNMKQFDRSPYIYICPECMRYNIDYKAWADINTDSLSGDVGDGEYYCNSCCESIYDVIEMSVKLYNTWMNYCKNDNYPLYKNKENN